MTEKVTEVSILNDNEVPDFFSREELEKLDKGQLIYRSHPNYSLEIVDLQAFFNKGRKKS
jgi:hypothetical protein